MPNETPTAPDAPLAPAALRAELRRRFPWIGTYECVDFQDEVCKLTDWYYELEPPTAAPAIQSGVHTKEGPGAALPSSRLQVKRNVEDRPHWTLGLG